MNSFCPTIYDYEYRNDKGRSAKDIFSLALGPEIALRERQREIDSRGRTLESNYCRALLAV
jgi:hypothetical protein